MRITIPADLEAQARKRAQTEGLSIEEYLERLIREDLAWKEAVEAPLSDRDPEYMEIRAAVDEGLAQAERGEGKPAREVFAQLRARHGLSR